MPIIVLDEDLRAVVINTSFKKLFGSYKKVIRKGQKLEKIFENDPMLRDYLTLKIIKFKGNLVSFNFSIEKLKYRVIIFRIKSANDEVYMCVSFEDITITEEAEMLRKQFISNVTHELRTPLAAISSISEMLAYHDDFDPNEYKENSLIIYNEIQRLNKMVSQLLDISKYDQQKGNLKFESFNVNDLINDLEGLFSMRGIIDKIKLSFMSVDVLIYADYERMKQVMINLIENAFHYTKTLVSVVVYVSGSNVKFAVRDDGIGLDHTQRQKVFERFYRTDISRTRDSGGAGLGLSIVYDLVKAHEGEVYVHSEVGHGSEFIVEIPKRGEND